MKYSFLIGSLIFLFVSAKAYGQDSVVRRDTIETMIVSYYDEYVSVSRLNGGLGQSDFRETFQYNVDRNKNAMLETVEYKLYPDCSKIALVIRKTLGEAKLQGVKRLTCPLVLSRSLNVDYFEIWGELPMWTSEDYCKVYNILNNVRITGFTLWKEPVPYVFFTFPVNFDN